MSSKFEDWEVDFVAKIRLLTPEEGGRKTPTPSGIRWNFCFADEYDQKGNDKTVFGSAYPIFPDHLGEIKEFADLGDGEIIAHYIFPFEPYRTQALSELETGTRFYSSEGPAIMAEGVVTKIIAGSSGLRSK